MLRCCALFLALVAVTGCSLTNPFVVRPETRLVDPATAVDPPRMTLPQARQYAARVKDRYRGALGDQAQLTSWLGIGLIPLSAAAIGLGASGGPAAAVLATGLAGGAGLGTGMWLINRPRQAAYVAGIKAVTCSEDAIQPLDEVDATALKDNLAALGVKLPTLRREIAILTPLVADLERDLEKVDLASRAQYADHLRVLNEAKAELGLAAALVTSAETADASGTSLHRAVGGAGQRLRNAVEMIVATVDGLIVESMRDENALTAIISGLGGTYKTIVSVPEPVKATMAASATPKIGAQSTLPKADASAELTRKKTEVEKVLVRLRAAESDVDAPRRKVAAEVNGVDLPPLAKKLEGCGVKAGEVIAALAVEPAGPIMLAKGSTAGFVAKGGVPSYHASIRGPSDAVIVDAAGRAAAAFVVKAAKDAAAGTYVVTVSDDHGSVKQLDVVVGDAQPADDTGPKDKPSPKVPDQDLDALSKALDGKVVEVKGSGVWLRAGPARRQDDLVFVPLTVDRVKDYKADAFTKAAVVDALRTFSATKVDERSFTVDLDGLRTQVDERGKALATACANPPVESGVKPDAEPLFTGLKDDAERKKLQKAVGTSQDGSWGSDTKHRLKLYQCKTGRLPDGKLTPDLVKELLR